MSGVIAQPKLLKMPLIVSPCPGVSMAPNGFAMESLAIVMSVGVAYSVLAGFEDRPSRVRLPSMSVATA